MQPRRKVALIVETSNAYARDVLHGVRAWVREHGSWSIRLSEQGRGADVPRWMRDWEGDGIIARVENRRIAAALRATGRPVVDVSAALPVSPFPRVITDSRAAVRMAAAHLMERGFTQFGYCGDPRFLWSRQRGGFFKEELASAGYQCDHYGARKRGREPDSSEREMEGIRDWLAGLQKPVAVLACYDIRGQQVLEACQAAGLAVPDEVAVMGVHNDELLCDLCDPPLTSVIPNARRAGYEAAAILSEMMDGRRVEVADRFIEPIGVAPRQSTDVVAIPDAKVSAAVRFIREHATGGITVHDVLRAVPISRTLLERRFKQWLGRSPHEQILRVRLDRVKSLLGTTDLPVALIAERAGFEHAEYLSVAFRRETGQTPSAWRTRHRVRGVG